MQVKDLVAQLLKLDQNADVEAIVESEELNLALVEAEEVVSAEDSNTGRALVFLYCDVAED